LRDVFRNRYGKTYQKAVEKLFSDWERMVTFYSFPTEHWTHIRTTNVVESPFSAVRLRTDAAKRFKKVENATAMIWKLLQVAEKNFRTLQGCWLLPDVHTGRRCRNGVMETMSKGKEGKAAYSADSAMRFRRKPPWCSDAKRQGGLIDSATPDLSRATLVFRTFS